MLSHKKAVEWHSSRTRGLNICTQHAGRRGSASPPDSPRGQQQPGGPLGDTAPAGPGSEQDAEAAYHRMELLSQSIRNELQRDLHIHDSAVLPNFVNLPQVCALQTCPAS